MNEAEKFICRCLIKIGFEVKYHKMANIIDPPNTFLAQYKPSESKNFTLDFALEKSKIAIEVDGDYWHGKTNRIMKPFQIYNKLNDSEKNRKLRKFGWKILRISPNLDPELPQKIKNAILKLMDI